MTGISKTNKQDALKKLNKTYKLGLKDADIESFSVAELKKKLLKIRLEHNLVVHSMTKMVNYD